MINKLAFKIASKFINNPNIIFDKIEIYQYGFFILLSNIFFLIITIIFGLALNLLEHSLVFYIFFFVIRQFAGGYHASTETKCEIISALSIFVCLVVIRLSKLYGFDTALFCLAIVAAISIAVFCPLDTPEKPLSEKEFKYFRKISWVILFVITGTIVISYCFRFNVLFAPCCMSLILESVLIIAGKIKQTSNFKKMQSK